MTKSEFVDKVADSSGLSKKDAGTAVDAVIKSIEDALKSGEEVSFTGFGKFHVAAARRARGPQPAHRRDDADRREQGPALHGRLGPQEGHQVDGDGRRFVGRRRSVARRLRSATASRRRSPRASPRSSWGSTPTRPRLWPDAVESLAESRARLVLALADVERSAALDRGQGGRDARLEAAAAVLGALPRAGRRRRPGLRRGQAAARMLRAARASPAGSRSRRSSRTRARRACS